MYSNQQNVAPTSYEGQPQSDNIRTLLDFTEEKISRIDCLVSDLEDKINGSTLRTASSIGQKGEPAIVLYSGLYNHADAIFRHATDLADRLSLVLNRL